MVCPFMVRGTLQRGTTRFSNSLPANTTLVLGGSRSTAIFSVASTQRSAPAHCLPTLRTKTPPPARGHFYSTARAHKTPPMEHLHYLTIAPALPIQPSVTLRLKRIRRGLA